MLSYLVASKARRRLLTLLWAEGARGTATQLAKRAHVSFASAYRELRAMDRWGLVTTERSDEGVVYAARRDHADADLLERLVRTKPARDVDVEARDLRAHLAAEGAPLRSEAPRSRRPPFDELVTRGVELARRDPEVARALPVLLYRHRAHAPALVEHAAEVGGAHRLGFFLALTGRLARDTRMERLAGRLRDDRVRRQDLFQTAALAKGARKNFRLARAWGLHADTDLEWFQSLFDKFSAGEHA